MGKNIAYDKITDAIIQRLEEGTIPWRCPWTKIAPQNAQGRRYRGINVMMLGMQGYSSPVWVTYKQAQAHGGKVRPGEKATPVVFWKWLEVEDEDTGEPKKIPFLRYYNVFNTEQCEGLDIELPELPNKGADPIEAAEGIVTGYPKAPQIHHGGTVASYTPMLDLVNMPVMEAFESTPEYYDTLFHELTHSTGHKDRLNRSGIAGTVSRFGSEPYAQEELVAEIGGAMLCHEAGLDIPTLTDNSAAYIASWLKKLKNDKRLVVMAAAQAQKAVEHILGTEQAKTEQED